MPSDWDGSGHYRCLHPARELLRRGHSVVVAPHRKVPQGPRRMVPVYGAQDRAGNMVPIDLVMQGMTFDALVMQQRREPGIAEWLERAGWPVVVDSDDAWFDVPAYNPASLKPSGERANMVKQLRVAAAMTVSTPELAVMYEPFCPDVTVVRNSLDWGMWENVTPVYEKEWRRVRVGYMGHADWHSGDLRVLAGVLGPWLERNPQVEFVAAGDPAVHDLLGVPRAQRVSVAGTEFWHGDLCDITACFDIGLVPLARNRMNECKSHLKGLEYAACGIPVIATPTESYDWWLNEVGAPGFQASKPKHWTDALDLLVNDAELRLEMGRQARRVASEQTVDRYADQWESVYERVCGVDRDVAGTPVAA